MKKILISIAIFLMATTVFAKRPTGLTLGGGFAGNFMCLNDQTEFFGGPFVEVGYQLPADKMNSFYFAIKWASVFNTSFTSTGSVQGDVTHALHYVDIPLKYVFSAKIGSRNKFFFDLGPTVSFWPIALTHVHASGGGASVSTHESWFKNDMYNRVNLYLGGNIGFIFNHVKVYAGYDQGCFSFTKEIYGNIGQMRIGAAYVF